MAGVVWIHWLAPGLIGLLEKVSPKGGQAAAAGLAVLLSFDVMLSAAAFLRMDERSQGQTPDNRLELILDVWYDDHTIQRRYPNMTLPRSSS